MTSFICLICHVGHSLATDTLIQLLLHLNSLVIKTIEVERESLRLQVKRKDNHNSYNKLLIVINNNNGSLCGHIVI